MGEVARRFPEWLRTHPFAALISAVVGGAFGYVWNVWLIAVRYGGDSKVPGGAPATGDGNLLAGALFWSVAGVVIFGIGSYWYTVGTRRFFGDLRGLPGALAALISGDRAARVHLLWGAAVGMLAAVVLAPSLSAVLAIGLLVAAPGVLGSILANFVGRVWSKPVGTFAPTRRHTVTGVTGMAVGLLGAAAALLVAAVIPSVIVELILVLVLAGAALVVSRIGKPPAATMLLLTAIPVLAWLINPVVAFAEDGGWQECRDLGEPWFSCPGTPAVLAHAGVGGVASAVGALAGTFLGAIAGTSGNGGPGAGPQQTPPPDPRGSDQAAMNNWIQQLLRDPAFQRWRANYPGYPDPPSNVEFNAYMKWRHAQGLPDPPLVFPLVTPAGNVVDTRVISSDDARRTLWAATHPPNQPYDPNAPLPAPTGDFPPGIRGGEFTTRPDGTIDPDKPISLTVDWHHPATPPTDQWLTPPEKGFDPVTLASTLQQNFGMRTQTVTDPEGRTYVKIPDNLPPNVAGSTYGTKVISGQTVFDPDSPIRISHWPTPTPTPTPPPSASASTPPPTPKAPVVEDPTAARLAQLREQAGLTRATHDTYARNGQIYGALASIGSAIGVLADAGVNIIGNFTPVGGTAVHSGYATVEAIAGGIAEDKSGGVVAANVIADNTMNVEFGQLPGGERTATTVAKIGNGVGNTLVGAAKSWLSTEGEQNNRG
ncbi:hypothetical protein [Nocardia sp. NPDC050710]|uniref:hypothetical protein n=1 Tax=Nocardia sp. NPDC050710 TaxID=3157220 RepID=UPI0033C1A1E6